MDGTLNLGCRQASSVLVIVVFIALFSDFMANPCADHTSRQRYAADLRAQRYDAEYRQ